MAEQFLEVTSDKSSEIIIIDDDDQNPTTSSEKVDCEEEIESFQTNDYSPEQLYVLICIWARQFEDASPKAKADLILLEQYLNTTLEEADTKQFLTLDDKNLSSKVEELLKEYAETLQKIPECGLCKVFYYTKQCMRNCVDQMLSAWGERTTCPFRQSGFSSLAMKEIEQDVKYLHETRCCCTVCATIVANYDKFAYAVALHEEVHEARKDF